MPWRYETKAAVRVRQGAPFARASSLSSARAPFARPPLEEVSCAERCHLFCPRSGEVFAHVLSKADFVGMIGRRASALEQPPELVVNTIGPEAMHPAAFSVLSSRSSDLLPQANGGG